MSRKSHVDRKQYPTKYSLNPHEKREVIRLGEANEGLTLKEIKGLAVRYKASTKAVFYVLEDHSIPVLPGERGKPSKAKEPIQANPKVSKIQPKIEPEKKTAPEVPSAEQEDLSKQWKELGIQKAELQRDRAQLHRDRLSFEKELKLSEEKAHEAELVLEADDGEIQGFLDKITEERAARLKVEEELKRAMDRIEFLEMSQAVEASQDDYSRCPVPESMMVL